MIFSVDLLGLLNWTSDSSKVTDNLSALMKVGGEEVVKFLQDVLDALFNILMLNSDSEIHDEMVFSCLVGRNGVYFWKRFIGEIFMLNERRWMIFGFQLYVIGLVLDQKYQHFQPVLDLYIQESFSATLAYKCVFEELGVVMGLFQNAFMYFRFLL